MTGARRGLSALLLLAAVLAGPPAAGAEEPIAVTPSPFVDLSNRVEWCASAIERDVATIAAGGCHFAAATPADLARGFSSRAYWLRMTLVNPEAGPVQRWLRIGSPRLERVTFFEATADGGWRRSDSGFAVPLAKRPVFSSDAVLPVRLAAGESRAILVRVVSDTAIDLTPALWQVNAYLKALTARDIAFSFVIGVQLMTGLFSLIIYFQWKELAYLFFCALEFSMAVFCASFSGLLPVFLWPVNLPFDIRIQAMAVASGIVFFTLFARRFIGVEGRYRPYHAVLLALCVIVIPAVGWASLVDYGAGMQVIAFCGLAIMAAAVALFWRAWRDGVRPAGFLLVAHAIVLVGILQQTVASLGGPAINDTSTIVFMLEFLLSAPIGLFGIAMYRERLERRLAAVQRESDARVEFLARMSHELRTPLDTILGTVQLLSRPSGPVRLAEGLTDIRDSGRHLLKMIDEILDHARGLAGRLILTPQPVDLREFLRGVEHNARVLAARNDNSFSLRLQGEPMHGVRLDDRRLRQILDNLLANAARHTKGGRIDLACVAGPAKADGTLCLDFAVTDSGEGIPLADQARIFLPFERGSRTVSRHGGKGAGMGLAISRQLVEMMGGRLTVESRPGQGASFRFRVVAEAAGELVAASAPAAAYAGYAGDRRTLLVADDEAKSRNILARFLRDSGFDVLEAGSGREAIERCTTAPAGVDLVLTDQFMADGDGWMVLRGLADLRPDVPVVLISAAPPDRPEDLPATQTFAASLLKPLDHAEVLRCIGDLLGLDLQQEQAGPPEPTDGGAADARPGPAALDDLRRMIDSGQVTDIMGWAESLKASQPACGDFAERVRTAACTLDFPALNALAELPRRVAD